MKKVITSIKWVFKGILAIIIVFLGIYYIKYIWCPIYDFPEWKPFSGDKLYNPYKGIDSLHWLKGNFQAQSLIWGGITDGRKNTPEEIYHTYRKLGYHIIGISDYMSVNHFGKDSAFFIPIYEHGYGFIRKYHQILIGASEVHWKDYPFWQNRHHKQHILNKLRKDTSALIALAHPSWGNAYTPEDVGVLANYDLFEVLNQQKFSVSLWDEALSRGKPAFILSDDDTHGVSDPHLTGRGATFIYAPTHSTGEILHALKTGKAYGVDIYMREDERLEEKMADAENIPYLSQFEVHGDTIKVKITKQAKRIIFLGKKGRAKMIAHDATEARYVFEEQDPYIRTEIIFPNQWNGDGTHFFLNPVFRYSGDDPLRQEQPVVNPLKTWGFRTIMGGLTFILIFRVYKFIKRRKWQKIR
ncbi:MAG: hypothetical protein FJY10_09260 [Bacteroidetes bacterium]|nr:hypothetical protein [Bacteroidota bacterium]